MESCYICPGCGGASGLAVYKSICFDCMYPKGSQKRADLVEGARAMFWAGDFSDGKLPGDTARSLSNDFDTNNYLTKENY